MGSSVEDQRAIIAAVEDSEREETQPSLAVSLRSPPEHDSTANRMPTRVIFEARLPKSHVIQKWNSKCLGENKPSILCYLDDFYPRAS